MRCVFRQSVACALFVLAAVSSAAQELTPRAYWPAPHGTKLGIVGYSYTTGDIVTDPSLPVVGVNSRINTGLLAYVQTLRLWGRTSNILIELPYSQGTTVGSLEGQPARRDLSGLGDIGVTVSVNVLGAPTMTPTEFQQLRADPREIVGVSVKVLAPTGDYEPDKILNVGTNRWSIKGEVGSITPLTRRWLLELEIGAWLFGDNDDFVGQTREQNPVFAFEAHLVRRLRPGLWLALDANFYNGGRTTIDGEVRADLQRNSRFGATLAYPVGKRHGIKFGYSFGVVTESGGDFDMFLVSYRLRFD